MVLSFYIKEIVLIKDLMDNFFDIYEGKFSVLNYVIKNWGICKSDFIDKILLIIFIVVFI